MTNEKENGYFSVSLCERSFGVETSTDFTLPDYHSEIRRVLAVTATPLPPAVYVGSDTVEFNGTLDYQLLYVGGDGGVYTAPLSGEYSFNTPFDKGVCESGSINVLCSVIAENVSARVSAPRKLTVRSRLCPNVRMYGKRLAETQMTEIDPTSVYTRQIACQSLVCEGAVSDTVSLSASFALPSEDTRVISADARVIIDSCENMGSNASCRGRVALKLLCVLEDSGEYRTVCESIPFETTLDVSGTYCRARGLVSEMAVNITDLVAECNLGVLIEAVSAGNDEIVYTSDVYSTKNECECKMVDVSARRVLALTNSNMTFSERMPIAESGIPEDVQIIDAFGNVFFDRCELIDTRYVFGGSADYTLIYKKDGEVYSGVLHFPIKYQMSADTSDAPISFDCKGIATDVRARLDGGDVRVDCEILISADCVGESIVRAVENARFGEALPRRGNELLVCYPEAGDTTWSVAKRYKVAPSDIIGDPSEDKYIIIE